MCGANDNADVAESEVIMHCQGKSQPQSGPKATAAARQTLSANICFSRGGASPSHALALPPLAQLCHSGEPQWPRETGRRRATG